MNEENDIGQLLVNLQIALDNLNKFDDVDALLNKLDKQNNKTELRKVKSLIADIHKRTNVIRDKVHITYKHVKVRQNPESEEHSSSSSELEEVNEMVDADGRYSPIIGNKATKSRNVKTLFPKSTDKEKQVTQCSSQSGSGKDILTNENIVLDSDKESLEGDKETVSDKTKEDIINETQESEVISNSPRSPKDNSLPFDSEDLIESTPLVKVAKPTTLHNCTIEISSSPVNIVENSDKEENAEGEIEAIVDVNIVDVANDDNKIPEKDSIDTENTNDEEKENSDKEENAEGEIEEIVNVNIVDVANDDNKILEKDCIDTEKTDDGEKEGENAGEKPTNPHTLKIKLVDINKLLAPTSKPLVMTPTPPRGRKSVTFDASVIVLDSSDDDTPKKTPKESAASPLKSALRKAANKDGTVVELSDSDSKENNENHGKRDESCKGKEKVAKSESDESDSNSRSRRRKNVDKRRRSQFSELVKEMTKRKIMRKEASVRDQSSDIEEVQEGKNKSKKRPSKYGSESDSEVDSKDRKTKRTKRESNKSNCNLDKSLSKTKKKTEKVSESDSDREHEEPNPDDPKFKAQVRIGLPKYKCEELQDLYKRNRKIFEVKKVSKLAVSPRRSRSKTKSNQESEKPGIKLTLKLNKKNKREGSSGDGSSSTEDNAAAEKNNSNKIELKKSKRKADQGDKDTKRDPSDKEPHQKHVSKEAKTKKIKGQDDEDGDVTRNGKLLSSDEENNDLEKQTPKNSDSLRISDSDFDSDKEKEDSKAVTDASSHNNIEKRKVPKKRTSGKSEEATDLGDSDNDHEGDSSQIKSKKKKASATGSDNNEEVISDSDSDLDFAKFSRKKSKSKKEMLIKAKKRMQKKLVISDSDSDGESRNTKKKRVDSDDDTSAGEAKESSSSSEAGSERKKNSSDEEDEESKSKPSRSRIKRVKDSSSDDDEKSTRKHLRRMIDRDSLSETTKKAEADERERKARIAEKQTKYNKIFELKADVTVDKVVLDFDDQTEKPLLSVNKKLVKHLKPHQVLGVKFMWDACFESLARTKKSEGGGCILAHCMGLGKTLQVIALVHTLLMNAEKTNVRKVLVVSPVNTVLNWKSEFRKWLPDEDDFEVYELVSCKTSYVNQERNHAVKCWHEGGGVLIIGYNMFRNISNPDSKSIPKRMRSSFQTGLVDPGADLVICDEGHLLKNEKTNISIAMNRIRTQRRIVLTGTPLQNNLREYWCMVQFIKPNLLGTYKEYLNRFVNPIINGQYTDSTQHDIMIMRRRSHVLHKLLDGVVQRQDYEVLEPYLPPKYEYVLFLKLTPLQVKLYRHYLDNFARKGGKTTRTSFLFIDFQQLQRICTHPRVLLEKSLEDMEKKDNLEDSDSEGSLKDFIHDGSEADTTPEASSSSGSDSDGSRGSHQSDSKKNKTKNSKGASSGRRTRLTRAQAAKKRENGNVSSEDEVEEVVTKHWWEEYINRDELDNVNLSSKIYLLFQILKECEEIGDKILVFSQSLYTLNCIEYFLARIDEATQSGESEKVGGYTGSWALGLDYFRLDGSSSCDNRANWCDQFNDPENIRARLFLISTKAGGLGINLVAANRVIIFDVSWNPSHDIQSIYRVYRFGQNKPSYIYRFVTYGTMEMKIYERQVTKQAISKRVIDEQQIDRHYSQNDIQELYMSELEPTERPIPLVPKDVLLGELLQKHEDQIYKYHEHQTLLENKQDEELNEEERKAAWEEFENEKVIRKTTVTNLGSVHLGAITSSALNFSPQLIQMALANIVRKDNPTWSDVQIKGILPALVTQLQVQMSENDYTMYARVEQEIRMMQAIQARRMRENYIKQYQMQMQKQQMFNQMLGNMNVTPEELRAIQLAQASQNAAMAMQGPSRANNVGRSSDVIELNDE